MERIHKSNSNTTLKYSESSKYSAMTSAMNHKFPVQTCFWFQAKMKLTEYSMDQPDFGSSHSITSKDNPDYSPGSKIPKLCVKDRQKFHGFSSCWNLKFLKAAGSLENLKGDFFFFFLNTPVELQYIIMYTFFS